MNEKTTIRLWDLPLRLFHWAVVLLIPAMWATAEGGKMRVHIVLGEVLLFLVAFRIVWGFVGSETARFASFVKGRARCWPICAAAARHGGPVVGHNPLGAFSVLGLIGLLALQVGLGLFATDTDQTFPAR
jgi:cytochrome b